MCPTTITRHCCTRVSGCSPRRNPGGGLSVTITGPVTVRQDSDIDTIVMHLADEIEARALAYGG